MNSIAHTNTRRAGCWKGMNSIAHTNTRRGVSFALGAAALFGASMPLAKLLVGEVSPVLLAALLYLGSGAGLTLWGCLRARAPGKNSSEARLTRADLPSLA